MQEYDDYEYIYGYSDDDNYGDDYDELEYEYDYSDYYEDEETITAWQRLKSWFVRICWGVRYRISPPPDDIPF